MRRVHAHRQPHRLHRAPRQVWLLPLGSGDSLVVCSRGLDFVVFCSGLAQPIDINVGGQVRCVTLALL